MSKVIVITGAGVGLGRALARRFVADGDKVVLLGRTLSKVQAVADELGDAAMAVGCDVGSADSVRAAFEEIAKTHAKIDVLINNAAIFEPFLIAEASDKQIMSAISANLAGTVFCSRAAIGMMDFGGHIINVSSESVAMTFPHLVMYQTTKAAVERFSEGLSYELQPSGIRVTTVRCGQMFEEGKEWDVPAEAKGKFMYAALDAGINLMQRPISQFTSVLDAFRLAIDSPADVNIGLMTLSARRPVKPE